MKKSPLYSVVITAHNAAAAITACLESIAANDECKRGAAEIVLVDDRSTDDTAARARSLGLKHLSIVSIAAHHDNPGLSARQQALDRGFGTARGAIILVCDADGLVPKDWISRMARPLEEGWCHAAAGTVEFRGSRWAGLQNVDSLCYLTFSQLLNGLGRPGGVFFGNFAFKKEVYEQMGGFQALGFALTEDLQFAREMHRQKLCIGYLSGYPGVSVRASRNWHELLRRTKRVSAGGISVLSLVLGGWLVSLLVLLVLVPLGNPLLLTLLGIRYGLGAGLAALPVVGARRFDWLPLVFLYEPLALVIGIVTLISIRIDRSIRWGGMVYER